MPGSPDRSVARGDGHLSDAHLAPLTPLLAYRLVACLNTDDLVALRESLAVAGHPVPEPVPETSSEISWESLSAVLEQLDPEASWKVLGAVMKQISPPFATGSYG